MRDRLGIQDFYSAHIMSTCQGQYTPLEVANGTVRQKDIHKNVTECDGSRTFNATRIVESALNKTVGSKVTLEDLKWPDAIEDGIKSINALLSATRILYIVAIVFICIALLVPLLLTVFRKSGGLAAMFNIAIAGLAFAAMFIASLLVTIMVNKGSEAINKYGNKIGVVAYKGSGFLAITWAATALMFLAMVGWIGVWFVGRKERKMERGMDRDMEMKGLKHSIRRA
jgi:uncharacterized membrane protein YhaH (DUF805 family)